MRVDQSGQNRSLAQVDDSSSRRNPDLALRSDISDSFAQKKHDLFFTTYVCYETNCELNYQHLLGSIFRWE